MRADRSRFASVRRLRRCTYASRVRARRTRLCGNWSAAGVDTCARAAVLRGCRVLQQLRLDEFAAHGADDLIDHPALLEEEQCGNRTHVEARARPDVGVGVEL